jgi:hypothetical protein
MKKICALTTVRNDDFYLKKWVEYYGAQLGRENLYVFFDGKDQEIPQWCEGVNAQTIDKIKGNRVDMDKRRIAFMSDFASELLKRYDLVIGTDADEFLIVDPKLGKSLPEYLSGLDINVSVSGLGVDVGQKLGEEGDIVEGQSFLSQRHYARLSTRYTKAVVLAEPVRWGSGFHRVKHHNFHIAKDLYLFHFGYFDMARIQARFSDKDRAAAGWTKHLERRAKTIRKVTRVKARDWDKWTVIARNIQTFVRPPYAWNKPCMCEAVVIVRIADRFNNIV